MDGSITLFAGVDVSKRSLDLCLLPDDRRQSFSYDEQGLAQLSKALPARGPVGSWWKPPGVTSGPWSLSW